MGAAAHRAIHQVVEGGRVFSDPLALRILGETPAMLEAQSEEWPHDRGLRFFIAARSELAEGKLAEAIEQRGVKQLVVLGAGLDTFGYRSPFGDRLAIFEVDHPATQAWKTERLAAAGIEVPLFVHFTPVDFEKTRFLDALAATGFQREQRSFFTWLGTAPYLTVEACRATLQAIASLAGGAEVVFDYAEAVEVGEPGADRLSDLSERVAAAGEPLLTWFEPTKLEAELRAVGFAQCEDFSVRLLVERHWGEEAVAARRKAGNPIPARGGHVMFARTE